MATAIRLFPMQTTLARLAVLLLCLCTMPLARADIYVIVNSANPLRSLSPDEVAALYLGRTRAYPNGAVARVLDQQSEKPAREQFFRLLVNMPPAQVNAYWARLTFTGRQKAPETQNDDAAMIAHVLASTQAIGYVSHRPNEPGIRVVLQLRE